MRMMLILNIQGHKGHLSLGNRGGTYDFPLALNSNLTSIFNRS